MTGVRLTTYPGLDERVTILRAGETVDAVFVRTQRFDVLVDTLDTPQACQSALDQLGGVGDRPLIVVNSHMDWDHFWGNAAVADKAVIVAHERALERFHTPAIQETLRRKAGEDARFGGFELFAPTLTFPDRLRLEGGDLTLELFPTPGHTPDHIAVWIPELRVCLAVDAVEDPIPEVGSDDPRDLAALIASLRAIQALGAEHVVLAHGQTDAPAVVDANLAYFAALAERLPANLWDLVPLRADMPAETQRFYEACHQSNLRATVRSLGQWPAAGI